MTDLDHVELKIAVLVCIFYGLQAMDVQRFC